MQLLVEEKDSTATSPSSSPRIPDLAPPKDLTQHLLKFHAQFVVSNNRADDSKFVKEVKAIIDEYKPLFREPPQFFLDIWQQRKTDLTLLEAAYELTRITKQDLSLFQACRQIAIQDDGLWINLLVNWNFVSKLKALLIKYVSQTAADLRLQPPVAENCLEVARQIRDLHCHYLILQNEAITLKNRLDASSDFKALQSRISQYLQELSIKQQALQHLAEEKVDLERKNLQLRQASRNQDGVISQHLNNIKILEERVAKLMQELAKAYSESKTLNDGNTLLAQQVQRLSPQSNRYVSQNPRILQENKELRAKLRASEADVEQKAKEITELKAALAENAKMRSMGQNQFGRFSQVAGANRVLVEDAKNVVAKLNVLGKNLQNSDISPSPVRPPGA